MEKITRMWPLIVVALPTLVLAVMLTGSPRFRSEFVDMGVEIAAGSVENFLGSGIVAVLAVFLFQRLSIGREVKIRCRLEVEKLQRDRAKFVKKFDAASLNPLEVDNVLSSWTRWMVSRQIEFLGNNQARKERWNSGSVRMYLSGTDVNETRDHMRRDIAETELQ
jgi:hypothetical protein